MTDELLRLAAKVADWAEEVLDSTDPENDDSHYCDHPRECAEAIAFDTRRQDISAAIAAIRALATKGESHD